MIETTKEDKDEPSFDYEILCRVCVCVCVCVYDVWRI